MKKTYIAPTQEVILRNTEHIFTMISGGNGGDNIPIIFFDDLNRQN